jgi:putative membrane protein
MSEPGPADKIGDSDATELASARTGLAFERTMIAADRTLMAIVRTALALIGFGFTINTVFRQLAERGVLAGAQTTGRRLGMALLALGILMLAMGIVSHMRFFLHLRRRRQHLLDLRLIHGTTHYNPTPTFVSAALLLSLGIAVLATIILRLRHLPR